MEFDKFPCKNCGDRHVNGVSGCERSARLKAALGVKGVELAVTHDPEPVTHTPAVVTHAKKARSGADRQAKWRKAHPDLHRAAQKSWRAKSPQK